MKSSRLDILTLLLSLLLSCTVHPVTTDSSEQKGLDIMCSLQDDHLFKLENLDHLISCTHVILQSFIVDTINSRVFLPSSLDIMKGKNETILKFVKENPKIKFLMAVKVTIQLSSKRRESKIEWTEMNRQLYNIIRYYRINGFLVMQSFNKTDIDLIHQVKKIDRNLIILYEPWSLSIKSPETYDLRFLANVTQGILIDVSCGQTSFNKHSDQMACLDLWKKHGSQALIPVMDLSKYCYSEKECNGDKRATIMAVAQLCQNYKLSKGKRATGLSTMDEYLGQEIMETLLHQIKIFSQYQFTGILLPFIPRDVGCNLHCKPDANCFLTTVRSRYGVPELEKPTAELNKLMALGGTILPDSLKENSHKLLDRVREDKKRIVAKAKRGVENFMSKHLTFKEPGSSSSQEHGNTDDTTRIGTESNISGKKISRSSSMAGRLSNKIISRAKSLKVIRE